MIGPGVEEVTHTSKVQVLPAAMLPALQENEDWPVTEVRLPLEQAALFFAAVEFEIVTPLGRLSVTVTELRPESAGA